MKKAPSSGKNGNYKRGKALHKKKKNKTTHNTKKPIQQPSETPNTIHNLKPQTHLQVCTPFWIFSPPKPSPAVHYHICLSLVPCASMQHATIKWEELFIDCYGLCVLVLGRHLQKATIATRPTSTAWWEFGPTPSIYSFTKKKKKTTIYIYIYIYIYIKH